MHGVADADLQWCYRHCEALLATSSQEGFGLPVAEAVAAGCPVVCSDIQAFRELNAGTHHYVPLNTDAAAVFSATIPEVMGEPRPAAVLLPRLAPEPISRDYLALYTRLLQRRLLTRYPAAACASLEQREGGSICG